MTAPVIKIHRFLTDIAANVSNHQYFLASDNDEIIRLFTLISGKCATDPAISLQTAGVHPTEFSLSLRGIIEKFLLTNYTLMQPRPYLGFLTKILETKQMLRNHHLDYIWLIYSMYAPNTFKNIDSLRRRYNLLRTYLGDNYPEGRVNNVNLLQTEAKDRAIIIPSPTIAVDPDLNSNWIFYLVEVRA